jgi:hypothetical protein
MREPRIFSITCETLGRTVELETRNWWSELDGSNEVIHYRAKCICGKEHVGFSLPLRPPGWSEPLN